MTKFKHFNQIFVFFIICLIFKHFLFFQSHASIEKLASFKDFTFNPADFDKNTLVLFDVDNVLLMKEDLILRGTVDAKKQFKSLFAQFDKKFGPLTSEQRDNLKSEIINSGKRCVIEAEAVTLIKNMQKMGAKVIMLTACQTGPCGSIRSLPEWRINELKHYEMNFEQAFPKIKTLSFQASDFKKDKKPLFKSGCLFSTGYAKGLVLEHFLKYLKKIYPEWQPKKVLFFDNKENNLQSVEASIKHLNIPYKGYFYTYAEDLSPIDLKLAEFQLHYLFEYKKWLTDDNAQQKMRVNNFSFQK